MFRPLLFYVTLYHKGSSRATNRFTLYFSMPTFCKLSHCLDPPVTTESNVMECTQWKHFGGEGHCLFKQSCVWNVFPPGPERYICWFATTLVVLASTTWILNLPCHFLSRSSFGGEQAALGPRKAHWQRSPWWLRAPAEPIIL